MKIGFGLQYCLFFYNHFRNLSGKFICPNNIIIFKEGLPYDEKTQSKNSTVHLSQPPPSLSPIGAFIDRTHINEKSKTMKRINKRPLPLLLTVVMLLLSVPTPIIAAGDIANETVLTGGT